MDKKFAFIGAGNMGGAIAQAVCKGVGAENVLVFDPDIEKAKAMAEKTGCLAFDSAAAAVLAADFIFLCVKPNLIETVLRELLPSLSGGSSKGGRQCIVSIAAGVTIETIAQVLAEGELRLPIIRLMPNTPVSVGEGMIVMAGCPGVDESEYEQIKTALAPGGEVVLIAEKLIDAATPVFSCSPAFTYMYIEALADGGVLAGLPRDLAQKLAAQAVRGSATMVLETGKHPGTLKDEVCSPGGSTIVGVEELEKNGFRGTVSSAVEKAYEKTTQLGKK